MSAEILARAISSAPEIIEGIKSGLFKVWGGVVRYAAGHPKGGRLLGICSSLVMQLRLPSSLLCCSRR